MTFVVIITDESRFHPKPGTAWLSSKVDPFERNPAIRANIMTSNKSIPPTVLQRKKEIGLLFKRQPLGIFYYSLNIPLEGKAVHMRFSLFTTDLEIARRKRDILLKQLIAQNFHEA